MNSSSSELVTVIVPVHNAEKTLNDCIESILNQTYKEIEIIIIDDGSTDNSLEICKIIANSSNIINLIHEENAGVSCARNMGLESAHGDFIVFVDSDDTIMPDYVESLICKVHEYNCDIVIEGFLANSKGHVRKNSLSFEGIIKITELKHHLKEMIDKKFFLSVWGKLYRKHIIDNYHIQFDKEISIGEDMLFNCTYFKYVNLLYVSRKCEYIYKIGENETSLTHEFNLSRVENTEELLRRAKQFCCEMNIEPDILEGFIKYYFRSHLVTIEKYFGNEHYWKKKKIIKEVLYSIQKQQLFETAVNYPSNDFELSIYQKIFKLNPLIVYIFSKFRHKTLVFLRGY